MVKANQDFELTSGDDRTLTFTVEDQEAGDGSAKDLTGFTAFTWKLSGRDQNGTSVSVSKTLGSGITVIDASAGKVQVTIADTDTADFYGSYKHELQGVDGSGNVTTLATGRADIIKDIIE